MSCVISTCAGCKHITIDKNGEYGACAAFPEGIPDDYYWGRIDVLKIEKCNNNVGYEEE